MLWFALWVLTPGLLSNGLGSVFTTDDTWAVFLESILALVLAVVLVSLHGRYNVKLLAKSRMMWAYVVPVVAAIALPFHYGLYFPVALYIFWMTVSVFWQNYLTFGLLQSYLGEALRPWVVLLVSATVFWLGHVLLLPERFAPTNWVPSLAILALGLTLGGLRLWLKSLHLNLALHLTFYFIFA